MACLDLRWRPLVQFEGYELENLEKGNNNRPTVTRDEAREKLESKLAAIKEPLEVKNIFIYI